MTLDFSVPVRRLAHSEGNLDGSYKVMVSLNVILTTGQGLLIFSMFVVDYDLIIAPIELFITEKKEEFKEYYRIWFKRGKTESNISGAKCHVDEPEAIVMEEIQHQRCL